MELPVSWHSFYAFIPGYSVRTYTDEQLQKLNEKENEEKVYRGCKYNAYQAAQAQRQMETKMRSQRAYIKNLERGDGSKDDILAAKARYLNTLHQYQAFSRKMELPEQMERVYMDGLGRVITDNRIKGMFPQKMVDNMQKDLNQYKRYKEVLGDSIGSLAKFGQVKYNDSEKWEKLQNRFSTYLEINKKDWSEEFKSKSKQAYDRFKEQGEELSVHALSRLPRLNKPGYEVIHEEDVLGLIKTMPNYSEGEEKMIWFSPSKQLVVVKNKNSGDIVSIVRRKNKKEEWTDAGL